MSSEIRRGEAERLRDDAQRAGADEGDITRSGRRRLLQGGRGFSRKAGVDLGELVPVRRVWCGFTRGRDGRPARAYRLVRGKEILSGLFTERSGSQLRRWFEREEEEARSALFGGLPIELLVRVQPFLSSWDLAELSDAVANSDVLAARYFIRKGGWHSRSGRTGPTGRPAGRPKVRLTTPAAIRARLEAENPAQPLETLAQCLNRRGRQSKETKALHDELARVVASAAARAERRHTVVSAEATAAVLGCTARSVYRLREKGREQMTINSANPEGLPSATYWAFRDWTPSVDPRDPFKVLYAPPARTAAVIDLQNRRVPVLREEAA